MNFKIFFSSFFCKVFLFFFVLFCETITVNGAKIFPFDSESDFIPVSSSSGFDISTFKNEFYPKIQHEIFTSDTIIQLRTKINDKTQLSEHLLYIILNNMKVDVKNDDTYNNLLLLIQEYLDESDKKLVMKNLRLSMELEKKKSTNSFIKIRYDPQRDRKLNEEIEEIKKNWTNLTGLLRILCEFYFS